MRDAGGDLRLADRSAATYASVRALASLRKGGGGAVFSNWRAPSPGAWSAARQGCVTASGLYGSVRAADGDVAPTGPSHIDHDAHRDPGGARRGDRGDRVERRGDAAPGALGAVALSADLPGCLRHDALARCCRRFFTLAI